MNIKAMLYPGATTKVYAHLMGWFGKPDHQYFGYDSDDPQTVKRQLKAMKAFGYDGAILSWYGTKNTVIHNTGRLLRLVAEYEGMEFGIMVEHGALNGATDPTAELVNQLAYCRDNFHVSPNYMRKNGRPLVLEFGMELVTPVIDWAKVGTAHPDPMFIFRDAAGFVRASISSGAFIWKASGTLAEHEAFYKGAQAMQMTTAKPTIIGAVVAGFNDPHPQDPTKQVWDITKPKRFQDYANGLRLADSVNLINKYYSKDNQLEFLQVITWNDHEEGTGIELVPRVPRLP